MKISSEHKGHRQRVKNKFLNNGIDCFEKHEILELLLFYCIPYRDTNEDAHKLLNCFGSFAGLFDASIDRLREYGLTDHCIAFIKLLPEICRLYFNDKYLCDDKIINSQNAGDIIMNKFIGKLSENVLLMLLDAKCKEVFCGVIYEGNFTAVEINIQNIISLALRYNAVYAIIAHNHPSGIALPSSKDIESTKQVFTALSMMGVRLLDHYIVADRDYVSLAESAILPDILKPW